MLNSERFKHQYNKGKSRSQVTTKTKVSIANFTVSRDEAVCLSKLSFAEFTEEAVAVRCIMKGDISVHTHKQAVTVVLCDLKVNVVVILV